MPSTAWSLVSSPALGDAGRALDELTQGGTLAYAEFERGGLLLGHLLALWCPCAARQLEWSFRSLISPLAEGPTSCQADA